MKLSEMQKGILTKTDPKGKMTARDLATELDTYPGPVAKAANCLVEKEYLRSKTNKDGVTIYSRTAAGTKLIKSLG